MRARARGADPTPAVVRAFRRLVYDHYRAFGRDLAWRRTTDPYRVLVSEIMLQQTQVPRVEEKYPAFLRAFPTFAALARAPVKKVLRVWQGMGYNRRALALQIAARIVIERHGGSLPRTMEELTALPGVGPATAADCLAFAFNLPEVVVETNIRAVFIHVFFSTSRSVRDERIAALVEKTLDRRNPREWYNALMDMGVLIKKLHANPARKSAHHVTQAPFEGSNRQLRSRILTFLLDSRASTADEIAVALKAQPEGVARNLEAMTREGFVAARGTRYTVARA